jgi:hypothetical protein
LNRKKWFTVAVICGMVFLGAFTKAEAARSKDKAAVEEKAKPPAGEMSDEDYNKALEALTPLAKGWTAAAIDMAFDMDDGVWDPEKLAAAAVLRASNPYREEMEKIWAGLPSDGENTPEMEVDRYEQKLAGRVKDLVIERRKIAPDTDGGKKVLPPASKDNKGKK